MSIPQKRGLDIEKLIKEAPKKIDEICDILCLKKNLNGAEFAETKIDGYLPIEWFAASPDPAEIKWLVIGLLSPWIVSPKFNENIRGAALIERACRAADKCQELPRSEVMKGKSLFRQIVMESFNVVLYDKCLDPEYKLHVKVPERRR